MIGWRSVVAASLVGALLGCGEDGGEEPVDVSDLKGAPLDAAPAAEAPNGEEAPNGDGMPPGDLVAPTATEPEVGPDQDGLWRLRWEDLTSFDYQVPRRPDLGPGETAAREEQIPDAVRAWEGRRVRIDGYMMPIEIEGDEVRLFNLFHSLESCCFGTLAQITNWIEVEMPAGEGVEYFPYGQIEVTGRLEIGEYHASGGIVAIYRLQGETAEPKW